MYIDKLNWCKHIDKLNKKSRTIQDLTPLFMTICRRPVHNLISILYCMVLTILDYKITVNLSFGN